LEKYTTVGADIKSVRAGISPIFLINGKRRLGGTTSEVLVPKKTIPQEVNDSINTGDILFYELDLEDALEELEQESDDLPPLQGDEGCKLGTEADGMGGCAVGMGDMASVDQFGPYKRISSNEPVLSDWNTGHSIKVKGGDCVDSNYDGSCIPVTGVHNGDDYISINTNGVVVINDPCGSGNRFYI